MFTPQSASSSGEFDTGCLLFVKTPLRKVNLTHSAHQLLDGGSKTLCLLAFCIHVASKRDEGDARNKFQSCKLVFYLFNLNNIFGHFDIWCNCWRSSFNVVFLQKHLSIWQTLNDMTFMGSWSMAGEVRCLFNTYFWHSFWCCNFFRFLAPLLNGLSQVPPIDRFTSRRQL